MGRRHSELFETSRVGEEFAKYAPGMLGGTVQSADRLASKQVEAGQEVVRTAAVL